MKRSMSSLRIQLVCVPSSIASRVSTWVTTSAILLTKWVLSGWEYPHKILLSFPFFEHCEELLLDMEVSAGSQPDFYGNPSSCKFMVFWRWDTLVILVKLSQFHGIGTVLSQASTRAFGQVIDSPSNGPDYREQKLTTSSAHQSVPKTRNDLTSTALFPFLRQPYRHSSSKTGGTGLSSNCKMSVTSMWRCCPTINRWLNSVSRS